MIAALRVGSLALAAAYAGVQLLWLVLATASLLISGLRSGLPGGELLQVAALALGLGVCGVAGTWWPIQAILRARRNDAVRCTVLAIVYLGLIGSMAGLAPALRSPPDVPAVIMQVLVLFALPPIALSQILGGDAVFYVFVAGAYVAALMLGAVLTVRVSRRVAAPDRSA